MERELNLAGGFGRYQWFVCIIMISGMLSGGFVLHGIAYLELAPNQYYCEPGHYACTPEEFCLTPDPVYKFDSIDYTFKEGNEPN